MLVDFIDSAKPLGNKMINTLTNIIITVPIKVPPVFAVQLSPYYKLYSPLF